MLVTPHKFCLLFLLFDFVSIFEEGIRGCLCTLEYYVTPSLLGLVLRSDPNVLKSRNRNKSFWTHKAAQPEPTIGQI